MRQFFRARERRFQRVAAILVAFAGVATPIVAAPKPKPPKPKTLAKEAAVVEMFGIRWHGSPDKALEAAQAASKPVFYWRVLGDPAGFM
jgi:hypothetical protein